MKAHSYRPDWKQVRRRRAVALHRQGWRQTDIAEALGVTKGAVSQWISAVEVGGANALLAKVRPGCPPKLGSEQLDLLPDYLSHGAEAYGFRGEVWTCGRIACVIEQEFGVSYHPDHVSRLLKRLRWTPQRPMVKASQRDEHQIAAWRRTVWPELKKKAHQERRLPVFIDGSGFYLLPAVVRTYAPCGQAPMLKVPQTNDHLSMMSGIMPSGDLLTPTRPHTLRAGESVEFLKHLQRHLARGLLIIWDRSPIHRGEPVREFLDQGAARSIHLELLPPYAPDLNTDEGIWKLYKQNELANLCCRDFQMLQYELHLATVRSRRNPDSIQSCFAAAGLDL